ncbi:methyltransferase [Paraglaciecola aestuariivivens]
MNTSLALLDKNLQLIRYPQALQHPSWQAWDAADEYLIEYVEQNFQLNSLQSLYIFNDDFGALACWFNAVKPHWVNDSYVARQSCLLNLSANQLDQQQLNFISSTEPLTGNCDLVLMKVPKTTALLEQQLIDLQKVVSPNTQIIAAGKAVLIQKSTLALFEKYLGPTKTSLAKKKSRLIFCQPTGDKQHASPYPTVWQTEQPVFSISNLANVFARQQLDIGARFMLQHLAAIPNSGNQTIVDLGCGNGVLGLHLLEKNKQAKVIFVDESYMAVASAKHNILNNLPEQLHQCEFIVNNCLDGFSQKSEAQGIDTIVCNPPFHQQNTITDHIAWQMFKDAKQRLKKGGKLFIIGNKHLDYASKLKRLFGQVQHVASNKKFSILSATQTN